MIKHFEQEAQKMTKQIITLTDAAATRIATLLEKSDKPAIGLRVSITTTGCSGHKYAYDFVTADNVVDTDIVVEDKGVKVFIDRKAELYMIGAEMDYFEEQLQSGFRFSNPNVDNACGCGESVSFKTPNAKM